MAKAKLPKVIKDCAIAAGGITALAKGLKKSRQAVYQWKRIPAELVPLCVKTTGLPPHQIRPDLYEK